MYKKIALVFLIIAIIIAGLAVYVFNKKQVSDLLNDQPGINNNVPGQVDANGQPIITEKEDDQDTKASKTRPARSKEELEKEINNQITLKDLKIVKEAQGRNYTSDELSFIDNPRQNIIDNMIASDELTPEEVQLLQ